MPELFPYQKIGVDYLKSHKKALLFDDPGLGKTAQALSALPEHCSVIVVCPASVKPVWEKEIKQWTNLKPSILSGMNSFRQPLLGEVVILNPEILPSTPSLVIKPYNLIIDEAHQFKTTKSIRAKKLSLLRKLVLDWGGAIWGLTGTPILTDPMDLYGVLTAVGLFRDVYGTYDNFLRVFNGRKLQWATFSQIVWGKPMPESGLLLKKFCLGRKRETVLPDLPTKTYETYSVPVKGYQGLLDKTEDEIEQLLGNPGVLSTARASIAAQKAKECLPYIANLAESEPLVVFSSHLESANVVADHFNVVPLTGEADQKVRQLLVEDFQSGKTNIIIGTIGAMGVGLTLTRANRAVFINRDWTPALNLQAEDRVCRIGQKKPVIITDIVCNDRTEENLYRVLMRKQSLVDNSVEKAR